MTVYLIRHAQAGSRARWNGTDDRLRPLTAHGRYQAADLVGTLNELGITEVRSSPYRRCIETVAPLTAALGIDLQIDPALEEGPADRAIALVRETRSHNIALCSHGDIIPAVLDHVMRHDALSLGEDLRCQKGSVWMLEAGRTAPTRFIAAKYLPPPH
jgi:broad specificity phosphatase PhoE